MCDCYNCVYGRYIPGTEIDPPEVICSEKYEYDYDCPYNFPFDEYEDELDNIEYNEYRDSKLF